MLKGKTDFDLLTVVLCVCVMMPWSVLADTPTPKKQKKKEREAFYETIKDRVESPAAMTAPHVMLNDLKELRR